MTSALDIPHTTVALPLSRRLKKWFLARPGVARLGVVVLLFIVWEIAARFFVDKLFLSPPSRVFTELGAVFETRGVPAALQITAWELAVAFAMSVVIGLVVGLAVGLHRFSHRSLMPIILLLYGTPQITILPLFILYFTTLFTQSFNPTKLLGLISVLAAMAIALNEIVRRAELHYSRWRMD